MSLNYIHVVNYYLPGKKVNNQQLANYLGVSSDWIDFFVGNKYRNFSYDISNQKVLCSLEDSFVILVEMLFDASEIPKSDIDAIVMATATPDKLMPATVNSVADRTGFNSIPTFQIQSGCSGAAQAMKFADLIISSGKHENVLVLGGDTCSKFFGADFSSLDRSEQINFMLFGDGVGGLIMSAKKRKNDMTIKDINYTFEGLHLPSAQEVNWFGSKKDLEDNKVKTVTENYKMIEEKVPALTQQILHDLMNKNGIEQKNVSLFMIPQLNMHLTNKLAKELNISDSMLINCVEETSNIGNGLPFVQLTKLANLERDFANAVLITVESSKWLVASMLLSKG
jgi:3-oxoacyl-[acyl-carrier-protein] synthase-3